MEPPRGPRLDGRPLEATPSPRPAIVDGVKLLPGLRPSSRDFEKTKGWVLLLLDTGRDDADDERVKGFVTGGVGLRGDVNILDDERCASGGGERGRSWESSNGVVASERDGGGLRASLYSTY